MKFWLRVFLTFFLTLFLSFILPWWSIAAASLIVGLTTKKSAFNSFLSGFLGIAFLWWGYPLYIDYATKSLLTEKISTLLVAQTPVLHHLNSSLFLIILTGVVGGIVGGFSSMTGTLFRRMFIRDDTMYYRP